MEDGQHFKLMEYGHGPQPLFSLNTLYQSMMQQALIDTSLAFAAFTADTNWIKERFYIHALESFWRITRGTEVYYLDAKTGEVLLNSIKPLETSAQLLSASASPEILTSQMPAQLKKSIVTSSYDPFDKPSWVNGKPLFVESMDDLKLAIQMHPKLTYMSKLYHKKLISPYALTGYHLWNEGLAYISLDNEGARYLPLTLLLKVGAFYP
jgi:hypothetical protein